MIPRPPLRFLALVIGGWIVGRVAWLLPPGLPGVPAPTGLLLPTVMAAATQLRPAPPAPQAEPSRSAPRAATPPAMLARRSDPAAPPLLLAEPTRRTRGLPSDGPDRIRSELLLYAVATGRTRFARASPAAPPADPAAKRFSGYAYLYVRPGGTGAAAVGPGGQLGASQAGLRVAYTLDRRFAVAARLSIPTGDTGASEAAAGLDYAVAKGARLSVERRVALGPRGRDAWSAYAAGGFYEGLGRGLELDGYGQAGVVGARRRDLFADGAIRGGRRLSLDAERALVLGAGAWGAAQPGAARLDVGPRAAISVPVGPVASTLALEGRMRVAGKARPGSGVALTLATDF